MKKTSRSDSALETLRIDHTELTQEQFAVRCGFALATYQRMVANRTPLKFTPEQLANVCKVCKVSPVALLKELGVDTSGIPDDGPPSK